MRPPFYHYRSAVAVQYTTPWPLHKPVLAIVGPESPKSLKFLCLPFQRIDFRLKFERTMPLLPG